MVECEYFLPAEGGDHPAFLVTVPSEEVLFVGGHLQGSDTQTLRTFVALYLLNYLYVLNALLVKNHLIYLNTVFERAFPQYQVVSILSKYKILSIKSVREERVHARPLLLALASGIHSDRNVVKSYHIL